MRRYYPLSSFLTRRLGAPLRKIPLDGPFSCPNRDGTLSRAGCSFCSPAGTGTGLRESGLSLREQWDLRRARLAPRHGDGPFLAYLQSHTNTHGPAGLLARVLEEVLALPGLAGLCVATRPDCLDGGKLELLAGTGLPFVQLDLGLQSADDAVLAAANRGHTAADFARAARLAAGAGLSVCAHVLAGLPDGRGGTEGLEGLLATVDFLNGLPVEGIKLHNVLVVRGSGLARDFGRGEFAPPGLEEYALWAALALERLRPDVAVQRLCADAAPEELLAPDWALDKSRVLRELERVMEERDLCQGRGAPQGRTGRGA